MRRFVSLAVLLFFTVPFGMSVVGCGSKAATTVYCSAGDSGPVVGQVATITISQSLATLGESLNYGQIGQSLSASAYDCKGNAVSVRSFTFASSDLSIADINPSTGQVCAGTWNRFTGGGIPDYTFCTAPANPSTTKYTAYLTATADGATSNIVPVYVHPVVTSVVIGNPITSACNDQTPDASSNCCSSNTPLQAGTPAYTGASCISQNKSVQLAARVYANGTTNAADNITCRVGHLSFSPQGATNTVTIDQSTGIATANQPGGATITATIANAGSAGNAGYFATCPPASIVLTANNQTGAITVPLNNAQPLSATVLDTNGNPITGLSLEFNSTAPQIIPGSSTVTPVFPGTAAITAVCQPGACNPSPYSQIGLYGNGKPVTSNGITVTSPGVSSTVIYAGSTSSQYIYPVDFSLGQPPALVKLPFVPNSMVITQDGSTIYMGSSSGLMTFSTGNNAVGSTNQTITGTVLSVSPDNTTLVVSDAARGTVSLVSSSGSVTATYGAVGTTAQWAPDSQTVYITAGSQLLTHSAFVGWKSITPSETYTDVAVTVPHEGAYFAGPKTTDGRSYCSNSTVVSGNPPSVNNDFYPLADMNATRNDRITATTDGKHILGATAAPAVLNDLLVTLPTQTVGTAVTAAACPLPTQQQVAPGYFRSTTTPHPLTGVAASSINGLTSATNSSVAFVTYTGTGSILPGYFPSTGAVNLFPLTGGATAPVSGVFSTDNTTFYTGTSGDNKIHIITIQNTTIQDTGTLTPNLPDVNGAIVAPNLLVQRPRRATS